MQVKTKENIFYGKSHHFINNSSHIAIQQPVPASVDKRREEIIW